jgi:hypothetical protein
MSRFDGAAVFDEAQDAKDLSSAKLADGTLTDGREDIPLKPRDDRLGMPGCADPRSRGPGVPDWPREANGTQRDGLEKER